jgi:phosphoribosylglycinamide formyltransferase-1
MQLKPRLVSPSEPGRGLSLSQQRVYPLIPARGRTVRRSGRQRADSGCGAPVGGLSSPPLFHPAAGPELSTHARVAVLASGGGSNLQALIDRFNADPAAPARVELVVGSRAGIGALERAERAGIHAVALEARALGPEAFGPALADALEAHRIDLIVLAGWLQLVPAEVVRGFHGRMINVHPALLPAFGGHGMYGMRVHRAVIESGARVSGATVHFVDEKYDEGAIIAQWPVPVLPGDTPESLAARVLAVEHRILPLAVETLARGTGASATAEGGPLAFDLVAAAAPADASIRRTMRLAHGADDPDRDESASRSE